MITKQTLSALIEARANKYACYYFATGSADHRKLYDGHTAGANFLLPALLNAIEALEHYRFIPAAPRPAHVTQYSEAAEALAEIQTMLNGGSNE